MNAGKKTENLVEIKSIEILLHHELLLQQNVHHVPMKENEYRMNYSKLLLVVPNCSRVQRFFLRVVLDQNNIYSAL